MLRLAQYFDNKMMYRISDFMDKFAEKSYSIMQNIAHKVKNMRPYDFSVHFDLLDALDPKQLTDPYDLKTIIHGKTHLTEIDVQNILNSADSFSLYEDLYGSIEVYPNRVTKTWFYKFKNPAAIGGLKNNFEIHNTEIPLTANIDVAVQKIHNQHPEAFIDPYAHEDEDDGNDDDDINFDNFDDDDYDLKKL